MSNLSKLYGYYGGVTNDNHYVPPTSKPFVPQPATVPFTKDMLNVITTKLSSESFRNFLLDNAGSITFRTLITNQPLLCALGIKAFEIKTQNNPNDIITYDTLSSTEDLLRLDGGTF